MKRTNPFHLVPLGDDWKMRACLGCEAEFRSTGPTHRMCATCRRDPSYEKTEKTWGNGSMGAGWHERDNACREAIGMAPRPPRKHPSDGWA